MKSLSDSIWVSVSDSVMDSVWFRSHDCISNFASSNVWGSVHFSIRNPLRDSVEYSLKDSVNNFLMHEKFI
jgi:hypothetical protein